MADFTAYTIGRSAADCRMALADLQRQTIAPRMEVIVVTQDPSTLPASLQTGFESFRFLTVTDIPSSGAVMASAVEAASSPYVCYAEEHSQFAPDWAEKVLAAHQRGYPVVGFVMKNANPGPISWAHYYGQFAPCSAPAVSGEKERLAGHHVSYSRELLLGYGPLLENALEDEFAMFIDLRKRGIRLYLEAEAVSSHLHVSTWRGLIMTDFLGHRTFAESRWKIGAWGWPKRFLYAAATPLVPLVRLWRLLPYVLRNEKPWIVIPQMTVPLLVLMGAGVAGETVGYLVGAEGAAAARLPLEMKRESFMNDQDDWLKEKAAR